MSRDSFSNVDAAWLHMDEPTNLMVITGFFRFSSALDEPRIRRLLEDRLLTYERFRQRVVEPAVPVGLPHWETDPNFDLDRHMVHTDPATVPDEDALRDWMGELASAPLPMDRPLWCAHLLAQAPGGGSLILFRLHHCIGDGFALLRVLLSMCDEENAAASKDEPGADTGAKRFRPLAAVARSFETTSRITASLLHQGAEAIRHPSHAMEIGRDLIAYGAAAARIMTISEDPPTVLKGPLQVPKRVAWSAPISLEEIKRVRRATGTTVNDIAVAALAGALRGYLEGRSEPVDDLTMRAMVPVSLRSLEETWELGNHFGLILLDLPVQIADPVERLLAVQKNMTELKSSPEAVVGFGLLQAMAFTHPEIEKFLVRFFCSKVTSVLTNVPGPRQPLEFAGHRIEQIMFWVPQSGRLGLGLSIQSYAGELVVGVLSDAGLIPDPGVIAEGFNAQFELLRAATLDS